MGAAMYVHYLPREFYKTCASTQIVRAAQEHHMSAPLARPCSKLGWAKTMISFSRRSIFTYTASFCPVLSK